MKQVVTIERGDVGECAVVVIAVQRGQRFAAARRPILTVHHQNVRPAIAIEVEEGTAGAQGLREILPARAAAVVGEADAGLRGHIGKLYAGRRRGREARENRRGQRGTRDRALMESHRTTPFSELS